MKNKNNKIANQREYNKKATTKTFTNYMQIAIDIARQTSKVDNEIPVGCVIVDDATKTIIAKANNETVKQNNPTKHAEIICINEALKKLKTDRLTNRSMYITLEPCLMCSGAISLAKVGKIYIGCESAKTGAIINNIQLFSQDYCNHEPEVYSPIMEQECKKLIKDFFKKKRNMQNN